MYAAADKIKEASEQAVLRVLLAKITMHTNQLRGISYFLFKLPVSQTSSTVGSAMRMN